MRNLLSCCVFAAVVVTTSSAMAQDATGVGVGAEATLTGVRGAAVVYDADVFRIDGILGFENEGDDTLAIGGRFIYVLHEGQASDFGIGGGLAFVNIDFEDDRDSELDTHIELIAQIRAFITPNVAVNTSFGVATVIRDNEDRLILDGQLVGALGIAYFFY